jgi:D-mannonate dehydratase
MLQTWRWFGPDDPVSLNSVRQAGAVGVVSALHQMNQGQVWSEDEVAKRRAEIEAGGLRLVGQREHRCRRDDKDAQWRLPRQNRQLQAVDP